jgi:glycerol uptake facilitator-like aquaporin
MTNYNYVFSEFVGTFIFVLAVLCICTFLKENTVLKALVIGVALSFAIICTWALGGSVAKAHLNPAVTTGFAEPGSDHLGNFGLVTCQFLGGALALGIFTGAKGLLDDSKITNKI